MIKRALIFLLCLWLPLNAAAASISGCAMVNAAMEKQQLTGHHCADMSDEKSPDKDKKSSCEYCKTHCSSASIMLVVEQPVAIFETAFFISHAISIFSSIYLDLPQRPPRALA